MVVQGKLRYNGSKDWVPFRLQRKEFVAMIDHPSFKRDVDQLICDVCLTHWIFDAVYGWWSAPRVQYVPNEPDKWLLQTDDMLKKLKRSEKGFTQR